MPTTHPRSHPRRSVLASDFSRGAKTEEKTTLKMISRIISNPGITRQDMARIKSKESGVLKLRKTRINNLSVYIDYFPAL